MVKKLRHSALMTESFIPWGEQCACFENLLFAELAKVLQPKHLANKGDSIKCACFRKENQGKSLAHDFFFF